MKKLFLLGIMTGALAFSCASTNSQSIREKKADIYFNAGTEALMARNYTDALASLIEAVKFNPEDPAAWTNLGLAYLGKGEQARAEECLKKALTVDAKWTDARNNLGALYLQQKKLREAEATLKEVLKDLIYPRVYQTHFNLSLIYSEWRKPLLAEQQLKLAIQNAPDYCPAWFRLGMLQKERGEFEMAAKSFSSSVKGTCFNNPQAHYEISSLLLKSKETARAKSKLLEIIQLFPQSDWAKKAELTLNLIR